MTTLAEHFWAPAYVWLRAGDRSAESAAHHCADFFTQLCRAEPPARDDPDAARFRDFILVRLREYAGAGFPTAEEPKVVQVDVQKGEQFFASEGSKPKEDMFNRRWALCVLEAAMRTLRREYAEPAQMALYKVLKSFLSFTPDEAGYSEAAKGLEMSGSALHMKVFNFRKRYRTILRAQIADTVRHSDDVDSELTVLLVAAS